MEELVRVPLPFARSGGGGLSSGECLESGLPTNRSGKTFSVVHQGQVHAQHAHSLVCGHFH
jgi:hypothetical protein